MYRLTSEQLRIAEKAKEVAEKHVAPHAGQVDVEGSFPVASVKALGAAGLLGLNVPKEHGGLGQGLRTAAAVLDELSRRCASTGMVYLMHLCGVSCYAAAPDRAAAWMKAAAGGKHLSTLACSEAGSRSHFWAPISRAKRDGKGVAVSAKKSWVTSAGHADGYVVSTGWADAKAPTDSMLYLMLGSDTGHRVSGAWNGMGLRGNASAPMALDGVKFGPERALCGEGKGFETMLGVVLPWFQIGNAAVSLGVAEAAVGVTQAHLTAQRFEHLGSRLCDLPNLRARLAAMRTETDRARAHVAATLDAVESGAPNAQLLVLEVKSQAAEAAQTVTDLGMKACGGAAFSKHLGLERMFRDARAAGVMAPTTDVAQEFIGRALCGMDLF
jgi:alkylation response protein AidB-like acyl-CoA dehydrogenase